MNDPVLLLLLLTFGLIGLLPRIFFKKGGSLNLAWWMTAGPLFVSPIFLIAVRSGWVEASSVAPASWNQPLVFAAVVCASVSMGFICLTLGTHRIPIALWHQEDDAPRSIVTWGAYSRVRHPFYFSFLLSQAAALCFFPHLVTGVMLVLSTALLWQTARREERRLLASEFGDEYADYVKRTWRLIPRPTGAAK